MSIRKDFNNGEEPWDNMIEVPYKKILFAISLVLYLAYNIFLYSDIDGIMGMIFFSFALVSGAFLAEDIGKNRGKKAKNKFFIIMIFILISISLYGLLSNNPSHMWLSIIVSAVIRGILMGALFYIFTRTDRK